MPPPEVKPVQGAFDRKQDPKANPIRNPPTRFIGGDRYLQLAFKDGMALIRDGKPETFGHR
ncbi:hypothetical protein BGZ49_001580 [Haplosporangium sp. Z 27]|nr:hypothetical protein BGZ49_001580 [Haplosporangium sp. Z 27]